jgi:hypothetical protein
VGLVAGLREGGGQRSTQGKVVAERAGRMTYGIGEPPENADLVKPYSGFASASQSPYISMFYRLSDY